MSEEEKLKQIKTFIFDDNLQNQLSEINNNLMDFNILEITGMGHQETKHSNILGWLFDDSEHNLEYKILDEFLKKVINKNTNNNKMVELKEYIYLSHKQDLEIYREKDNIDLLIVDEQNEVVITIENKVFASERKDGKDGGQLPKYKDIINNKYNNDYKKYFIFLTIDLDKPSQGNENWLIANHQMITDTIEDIIKNKQDISIKTQIIFESYIDLLKRKKIVEDTKLKELCGKIWNNNKYKEALEVLMEYKPDLQAKIFEFVKEYINNNEKITLTDSTKSYIRFYINTWDSEEQNNGINWTSSKKVVLYEFRNTKNKLSLHIVIGPSNNNDFRKRVLVKLKQKGKLTDSYTTSFSYTILKEKDFQMEYSQVLGVINEKLNEFFKNDFNKNNDLVKDLLEI